jgi:hypothetical protein
MAPKYGRTRTSPASMHSSPTLTTQHQTPAQRTQYPIAKLAHTAAPHREPNTCTLYPVPVSTKKELKQCTTYPQAREFHQHLTPSSFTPSTFIPRSTARHASNTYPIHIPGGDVASHRIAPPYAQTTTSPHYHLNPSPVPVHTFHSNCMMSNHNTCLHLTQSAATSLRPASRVGREKSHVSGVFACAGQAVGRKRRRLRAGGSDGGGSWYPRWG